MNFSGQNELLKQIQKEKARKEPFLRELWRECFGDPKEYEDFYFSQVYPKNKVYSKKRNGMLHLNPYNCYVRGQNMTLHYIVGVATAKSERRKGIMRNLLEEALTDMYEKKEPFTYLMPADVRYYEPFQFMSISRKRYAYPLKNKGMNHDIEFLQYEDFKKLDEKEQEKILFDIHQQLLKKYSVFALHDREYMDLLFSEKNCQNGDVIFCFDKKISAENFLGFFAYAKDGEKNIVEQAVASSDMEQEICDSYFCEEFMRIGKFPYMIRVLDAEKFLNLFSDCFLDCARYQKKLFLTDNLFKENIGIYTFTKVENEILIEKHKIDASIPVEITDLRMGVDDLVKYVFCDKRHRVKTFFSEVI